MKIPSWRGQSEQRAVQVFPYLALATHSRVAWLLPDTTLVLCGRMTTAGAALSGALGAPAGHRHTW